MPDWRYNVLSTSEAYINAEGLSGDPLAASYPRRADRTRPPHTCPYTTIFLGARSNQPPYRLAAVQNDSVDPYVDAYSVDRSSNLTDTSSFARYEDCRTHAEEISPEEDFITDKVDNNVTLQVQKVPYSSGVFFISTKNDNFQNEVPNSNLFLLDGSESDALSSCTCDSFERCEFDCRDFEPFSDTCCCDPLSDGVCSRSPKDVDSPDFYNKVVEEDCVSARSDMDGLDLALFEPAQAESNEYGTDSSEQNTVPAAAALCGILYSVPDNSGVIRSTVNRVLVQLSPHAAEQMGVVWSMSFVSDTSNGGTKLQSYQS
ncbi:unnamed protein product [Diatraea saccharalis]|uniref:Uncharacterized protein n=1 Tax=Diatraea saccharalis TaxID=40085 RepID=A0A9N9W6J4_9NEOP|nr:unnamed protein product [Diatraea saccharalis]